MNDPKAVAFIAQLFVIILVVVCCLVNLTFDLNKNNIWPYLLTGTLGYLIPFKSPKKEDMGDEMKTSI